MSNQIAHIETQLTAVAQAEAAAQADLGRAALALATGKASVTSIEDLEAEISGLQAHRRRLDAALTAARAAEAHASDADLQTQLTAAISKAQDATEQIKHAQALDKALRAALLAAQALRETGAQRRAALADAGRALSRLAAGSQGLEAAAMCSHFVDGTVGQRGSASALLNAIGEALGLPIELQQFGALCSTAELLEAESKLLAERLATWTPEAARAASVALED
ncbi:MAG: hypothetical protein JNJ71_10855 [Rubrivivax sp.]|nr:hypothetical protein [Rubrivivax sp.]